MANSWRGHVAIQRSKPAGKNNGTEFENLVHYHHLAKMAEVVDAAFEPEDFSFVVKMRGGSEKPWIWEVHRAGKSGPVERSPIFYKSMAEAAKEGKKALARILEAELTAVDSIGA